LDNLRQKSAWRGYRFVPRSVLPNEWRAWVLDKGSLTQRLIRASEGDFHVRLKRLAWLTPSCDEAQVLNLPVRQCALVREVELVCMGDVWVSARSVIPVQTLTGKERQLQHLGSKPLGAFLFSHQQMVRLPMQLANFQDAAGRHCVGRRSVFLLDSKPLLVSEIFQARLLKATNNRESTYHE